MFELQHLHDVLDVERTPGAALEIVRRRIALQLAARRADFGWLIASPGALTQQSGNCLGNYLHRIRFAIDGTGLTKGLPLPQGGRAGRKMLLELCQRHSQCADRADRPQERVDGVEPALAGQLGKLLDDSLRELREEMIVG